MIRKVRVAVVVSAAVAAIYLIHDRVMFQRLDQTKISALPELAAENEDTFSRNYPSYEEINAYLSDSTILISDPRINGVSYFDNSHNFISWGHGGLKFGAWSSKPYLKFLVLEPGGG